MAESWDDLKARDLGVTINCRKTNTLAELPSDFYSWPESLHLFPDDNPVEMVSDFQWQHNAGRLRTTAAQPWRWTPESAKPVRSLAPCTMSSGTTQAHKTFTKLRSSVSSKLLSLLLS